MEYRLQVKMNAPDSARDISIKQEEPEDIQEEPEDISVKKEEAEDHTHLSTYFHNMMILAKHIMTMIISRYYMTTMETSQQDFECLLS